MPRVLCSANVRVPEYPRVRYFKKSSDSKDAFDDVTAQVAKLVIEDLEDASGACRLLRLNAEGKVVWETRHQSEQETKWHVEFEYGLPEDKWQRGEAGKK